MHGVQKGSELLENGGEVSCCEQSLGGESQRNGAEPAIEVVGLPSGWPAGGSLVSSEIVGVGAPTVAIFSLARSNDLHAVGGDDMDEAAGGVIWARFVLKMLVGLYLKASGLEAFKQPTLKSIYSYWASNFLFPVCTRSKIQMEVSGSYEILYPLRRKILGKRPLNCDDSGIEVDPNKRV